MSHPLRRDSRTPEGFQRSGGSHIPAPSEERECRSEAALASLLDSLEYGVIICGAEGDLWAVNDRFAEILGIEPEKVRGLRNLEQIIGTLAPHFSHANTVAARWLEMFRSRERFRDELELAVPEKRILERCARPVLDRYRQPVGWLEIYSDITARRQIESRLFHSERLAALGQMVSGIAHELNNALTSILGYGQLVRKRTTGFEWEAEAGHILNEGERARCIVRNLLFFARGSTAERAPVNLNEIVERTLEIRRYELRLANIHVDLGLDAQLPQAIGDAAQIQQGLLNLILNAEQAIRQHKQSGHIWIRTRPAPADRVAVEVADDGPGVPPELVLRIFDPFFTTKPAGVGTGLGLSILYGIVHQHGGEVSVEDRPGGGAVFTIALPSAATASLGMEGPYLIRGAFPQDYRVTEKRAASRILVVEDEPTVAQLITDVLSEEGHLVDTVLDSREGLDLARTGQYQLAICDLRMPHLDGRAFYGQLVDGDLPLRNNLIFVTGDTLAPRTVDFLQKCGLPYLEKPFLVEELKKIVARSLDKATKPSARPQSDPIDRTGHKVQRGHWKRYEA
jgi:PAS domain S-box-containing protein